jgi:hypothetical protein
MGFEKQRMTIWSTDTVKIIDMNREIKFRGKRTDNGGWVYGYLIHDDVIRDKGIAVGTVNMSGECEVSCDAYRIIPETLGQLVCITPNTSMYVDNSFELYEGDLIRRSDGKDDAVYRIAYENCEFYGLSNEGDEWGLFTYSLGDRRNLERIEIVGNIHDNPDLLTAK